jgi:hypothetical protein
MFVVAIAIAIASLENDTVGDHFRQKVVEENPSTFLLVPSHQAATFSGLESSKRKPRSLLRNYGVYLVAWGRIELPTRGFSIRCSTN